jgi:hypothetical protein
MQTGLKAHAKTTNATMNPLHNLHNDDARPDAQMLNLQASHYPLMRRVNQHFVVDDKFRAYDQEISRLSALNKTALFSIAQQEQRMREIQLFLRPEAGSSVQRNEEAVPFQRPILPAGASHLSTPKPLAEKSQNIAEDISNYREPNQVASPTKTASKSEVHVTLTEVTSNSFTLEWDANEKNGRHNQDTIYDVETRYFYNESGVEKCVVQSCSRWCLRDPVPKHGKLTVDNLRTNAEYREVSIRFKNHLGWSEFSTPIARIVTSDLGESRALIITFVPLAFTFNCSI